jgi:hypothetical protein
VLDVANFDSDFTNDEARGSAVLDSALSATAGSVRYLFFRYRSILCIPRLFLLYLSFEHLMSLCFRTVKNDNFEDFCSTYLCKKESLQQTLRQRKTDIVTHWQYW